jgi:Skp family chaperone for outer membrane proteins
MKMKKISIVLLAVFFIGIANVNAQSDATTETVVGIEEVKEVKTCAKSGKVCDATCENKKNGTCCKGEKKKSCSKSEKASCSKSKAKCSKSEKASCSKNNEGSFNFDKSNSYGDKKSSCSKSDKKKGCCKKEATATSIK